MDKLQLQAVQFDVRGTRVENRVIREKIPIKDKGCPWIVPNGSPYFAENALVDIFNEAGGRLVAGTDYWYEGEFPPFCEITGRSICSFVKLSDRVLAENEFVQMTYQSIGAWFVPRNSIDEWVREIYIGKIPIPWAKVYNLPPTFPSSKHSHSIKTEIGDWYELTFFFNYMANIYNTRDPNVYIEADRVIAESFAQLKLVKAQQLARLVNHDKDYGDPHQINKFHLQLGNLDNFRTALPEEDVLGVRADLFSTPDGVMRLSEEYSLESDAIMRNGVLPVSYFGNGGYIPPTILGSFEGLGSLSECFGMCIEASGRVVVIQNHFDGRTEGLYFSTLSDYKTPFNPQLPYRFDYTAYRYEPPVLTNSGVKPNHIIAGSGNDIIMVGLTTISNSYAGDRWFIAMTNDSFDPSGHRYIETNMKPIFDTFGVPDALGTWNGYLYHGRMMIYLLDQYAVLAVDSGITSSYNQQGRMSYWRIPRQAMIDGTPATWELIKLTYQDWDGVQYNNANYWEFAQKQVSGGLMSRWGRYNWTTIQPPPGVGTMTRRILSLFAKKPGTTNIFYLNWISYTFLDYQPPGMGANLSASITNMVYEFNIVTGAMTLLYKQPALNIDYQNDNSAVVFADRNIRMQWYNSLVRYLIQGVIINGNGERLTSMTGNGQEQTVLNSVIEYTQFEYVSNGQPVTSRADLLSGSLGTDRIRQRVVLERGRNLLTPIPTGIGNRQLAYELGGENFFTYPTTFDPAKGSALPKVVCRNITGDYAVRPEVPNRSLSPVYSRPLINTVYDTNMNYADGVINMTGSAGELAGRGVEMGQMSLSYCGWSAKQDNYPTLLEIPQKTSALRAPQEAGAFISFPKTYQRVLDVGAQKVNYVPNDYYGISVTARNKLRSLIPAGQQGPWWCFELAMLNAEQGGMFGGLATGLVKLKYPTVANGSTATWDGQVFLVTPVVEAPNANHPGLYLITDFQVLGQSAKNQPHQYMYSSNQGAMTYQFNRPLLSIYREGNSLQCSWASGFSFVSGSVYSDQTVFNVDLGTGGFNGAGTITLPWNYGEYVVNIPKVGRSRVTISNPDTYQGTLTNVAPPSLTSDTSGGAARIWPVVNGGGGVDYYGTITSYPETGWAVFFLEEVAVMVQGTLYRATTGTVDLRDIDTDPRNKVFYVYITIEDNVAKYIFSTVKLRRGIAVLLVAVITTNEKQILTLERRVPFTIGDYELSFTRQGGIIPISSGFPQDNGVFKFLKPSELLP